ncbi:beta-ketoadipate pathway transcriptional regulator, PcaR/PcaU/PobR family [Bordetella pertussis H973]|uniref:Beta-ketoadipate pathway transcriptional regulator, PcaR/PcaU/PobR family n=4 Tax=Bordetella pertussis TaxID=520 RepID=A0AAI9J2A0_BORPT|nr:beta-ketoadipate pathway transcriptional regulator, PcaR/PcaU/PobR family [Bordetella pertussis CHLA-11]ETH01439.1 beta-ketoadipate pathway transcriptional regulator, PcaR/PcaU/PobR family [Bordetella pertussis 2250905]ETH02664.1 beta-ketoadipate pathway transcriptional regulator, PcaR/PcaU/PobR family [Bordetella pertussis 2356847]ETH08648.1 beta-ketoadipate pathway transcriptional regulator, PcaR/PcaU/PobR family [Bordetella pertussis 2371640]ETH10466.1 beta-ketoadipate pathway transcripti
MSRRLAAARPAGEMASRLYNGARSERLHFHLLHTGSMVEQVPQQPGVSYVQSFARGLSVIRAFGPQRPQMTLSEVAAATGLTRAGARRILLTLASLGYVAQEDRRFTLTPRILELGYAYLSATPLWDLALPYMEEVAETTRESCSVSVLDGVDIVYILRLSTHKVMTINLAVGSRLPAWVTSMGRVLLAGLPEAEQDRLLDESQIQPYTPATVVDRAELKRILAGVRADGYACVVQELEPGLQSVAVPIVDRGGRVIGAMNVSGHANRYSREEMLQAFLPPLRSAAEHINQALRRR